MKYTNNTIRINVFFILCIVLLFCLFFAKLFYIGTNDNVEGTDLAYLAKNRSIATKTITAERGKIYDNQGNLLAQNVNSYTVIAYLEEERTIDKDNPRHVVDKETTATELAKILEPLNNVMTKEYILGLLNQKLYQVELGPGGRGITETIKKKIESLTLPGIDFIKTTKRYYQNGDFASYIIGYAKKYDDVYVGELGIEGFVDKYLKGKDGKITYQKDAYGYQLAGEDRITMIEEAKNGYDVYLTLDKQIQIFLDNAVKEFTTYNTDWVVFTIADAKTGAIVGSATSPSFDLNTLDGITSYQNPLVSYTYEPGSTMKIFSFMSAIEEGVYKGDDKYTSGSIKIDDYILKDWNKHGWGSITYDVGFTYSSNVAAVKLWQAMSAKNKDKMALINYYDKLGFGKQTGIELSHEYEGVIDGANGVMYASDLATSTYGQGVTVTPIQMIKALTTITNDGTTLRPYIISKIVDPNTNKVVYEGKRTEDKKIYSTSTVNKIIELMDATVNSSDKTATGRVYSSENVRLIGKTGTAYYIDPKTKNYITTTYNNIRSFAGVFPKENPQYIIYVAVKDLHGTSKNMGNIVKNTIDNISKYKNIDERESDKNENKIVTVNNFLNKEAASAELKLKNKGLNPIVIGSGTIVKKQYPEGEAKVSFGSTVFLVTNKDEFTMPDMTHWSSKNASTFCKLTKINCQFNGYGYVYATNLKNGDIINSDTTLVIDLQNIEPMSLSDRKEDENNEGLEE